MNFGKLSAMFLAGTMAATVLTGCGNSTEPAKTDSAANENDKVYEIGLCQLAQHPALDEAAKGFQDKLTELLGEDKVKFDLQDASGDPNTCSTIVNRFVSSNKDLIFANSTSALQAAADATADIPIVGTSVTDYATALGIDAADWTGVSGRNITGTSDLASLADQAAMFKELLPDAKKIGLIYCSDEPNSKYQADIVATELAYLGCETADYSFADANDIAAVVTAACSECDALYIPTDNTAAANNEVIANIATPANIPIIAGEEGNCKGCGIATLSISYYSIGQTAGEMAYDILVNGKDPATMEIRYADRLTKKYVKERTDAFGIIVPKGYEELTAEE